VGVEVDVPGAAAPGDDPGAVEDEDAPPPHALSVNVSISVTAIMITMFFFMVFISFAVLTGICLRFQRLYEWKPTHPSKHYRI